MVSDGSVVLTEGTRYPESPPDTEIEVLKKRIARRALLLKLAGQPYFKALPSCHGYICHGHTEFGLVYSLPDSADPTREPTSLYSLLSATSRKNLDISGMTKRLSRNTLLLISHISNSGAESPLIQREGCVEDQGVYAEFKKRTQEGKLVPTNRQWREIQIATCTDPTDTTYNKVGAHQVLIDGKLMHQREYMGVRVTLPV
ncbi:unnamed protein product [Fusarium langsethiae]|nr:unnamed protein product [Fusarium langsethiae]